jgi:hypothetical protein
MATSVPFAFLGAGWIWGREVTVLQVCAGPIARDCPPDIYIELNLLAGWAAAAVVAVVLVVVARRLDR